MLENNDRLLYVWYISMEEYDNIKWPEDITHVQERPDGSSDGLPEAMDIDLGDGYKECSNWNPDITQKWDLEDLFRETTEPTAEQLVEVFNKTKEELFPGEENLTYEQQETVYKEMYKK